VWDDAHIAKVEAAELQLNRPICGARNLAGHPCTLEPDHSNGRCRFHGGFNFTGAQPGNRNGVIHGLYARSIQTCGDHCPMWKSCPCAEQDVLQLDPRDRPKCPYETAQYDASLTDALARVDSMPHADAMTRHTAHHVAMLQVMTMRAAGAIAENPMADVALVTAKDFRKTDRKMSVYVQAFLRLSGELRRFVKQIEVEKPKTIDTPAKHEYLRRASLDTSLAPEDRAQIDAPRLPAMKRAYKEFGDAVFEARNGGSKKKAREFLEQAMRIDAGYVADLLDPGGMFWDPQFEKLLPLAHAP
jgi:hypothetical protein